jgi:hypothetical protein
MSEIEVLLLGQVQSVREIQREKRKHYVFEITMKNGKRKVLVSHTGSSTPTSGVQNRVVWAVQAALLFQDVVCLLVSLQNRMGADACVGLTCCFRMWSITVTSYSLMGISQIVILGNRTRDLLIINPTLLTTRLTASQLCSTVLGLLKVI